MNELKLWIRKYNVEVVQNDTPTKYLCNYAYYTALLKNKNSIFIHILGLSKITNFAKFIFKFDKNKRNLKYLF